MARQSEEMEQLSQRLNLLEAEMLKIHRLLAKKGVLQKEKADAKPATKEQDILDRLFDEGLLRNPTREELKLAEKWKKLPETEKQAVINGLINLKLDPSLSEIINLNRAGRIIE